MYLFTEQDCRAKWKGLRDTYVRKKKQLKNRSGQAAKRIVQWKYLAPLSFLNKYLQERESKLAHTSKIIII